LTSHIFSHNIFSPPTCLYVLKIRNLKSQYAQFCYFVEIKTKKKLIAFVFSIPKVDVWRTYAGIYDNSLEKTAVIFRKIRFHQPVLLKGEFQDRIKWTLPLVWVIYRIRFSIKRRLWTWKPFLYAVSQFSANNFCLKHTEILMPHFQRPCLYQLLNSNSHKLLRIETSHRKTVFTL